MPRQLTFDLPVRPALGRGDFFVSPANALAVAQVDAGDWPEGKLLLIGPEGAGKSHLAQVWAGENDAAVLSAGAVPEEAVEAPAVVVEDADRIAGDRAAETALFHLHNHVLARGGRLLVTAASPPRNWGLCLPDLASRMEATAVAEIAAPDDALLAAVLVKLFADRQIVVAPSLIQWLVRRMDRSFASARGLVADLDARALARGGPVTREMARDALDLCSQPGS
ncbi:MAG: chromosomal replication initiator DnaA [Albidovulum sp.]|uniref:DnaA ATPase domain-containing protein n=1 Tax=Albidovulum sp. TaxID=1872424 RepID=UPI0013234EBA|nr:DnaA/Hda family protein [Defluviimonas sp.]KAB2886205.1 MAG: chromosomal replication initiator DnaA [Defluviimonas sp.]